MLSTRRDSQELSPKAKVSYDEAKFQVEFDVQDYKPEELSIKTEGDVLIVMAKHETKTEDGGSFVSKQFEQRFTLPSGVKPEAISSSLSREGNLIVTAPREVQQSAITGFRSPSRALQDVSNNTGNVYSQTRSDKDEGLPHPRVKYDEDKFQISLDCQQYKPEELDVKVEGNTIIIVAKQEVKEAGGTRTRVFEQKFSLPSGVKADRITSNMTKDGVLNITAPRGNASASSINQTIEQRMDRVLSPSAWNDDFKRRDSSSLTSSALSRRDDPPLKTSIFDDRSLFGSGVMDSRVGGGSSRVQYDDDMYRIHVDVQNFKPEELVIKTIGNVVQVEAKHEEKTSDGHSFSSRNFSQSFTLPRGSNPEAVTSALAKDGTLTISCPLPPSLKAQNSERLVPIKHN